MSRINITISTAWGSILIIIWLSTAAFYQINISKLMFFNILITIRDLRGNSSILFCKMYLNAYGSVDAAFFTIESKKINQTEIKCISTRTLLLY